MAYAVFKDGEKLSRAFPTKEEALKKANEAGLVEVGKGLPSLEDDLTIRPCPPDPESKNDDDLDWAIDQASPEHRD